MMANPKESKKAMRALKRSLIGWGIEEETVEKFTLSSLEVAAGLRKQEELESKRVKWP